MQPHFDHPVPPTRLRWTVPRRLLCILALSLTPTFALGSPGAPGPASSGADASEDEDLTDLSLEQLMEIEVTIASRSVQKLSDVPGAVYVITGDELRRSGHTTIQEALRMVPGFYVSNWTSAQWDVTSRGFGTGTSLTSFGFLNQLLVIVDGLVVYSPLFAGTWWGIQDIDLDDVERIEVIRGPGGLLWGSNAIHGVVHVITKSAQDTVGARLSARGGTDEWNASGRYGVRINETSAYRFYYRHASRDGNTNPFLGFSQDWYLSVAGARFDWGADRRNTVTVRGYQGRFDNDGFDTTLLVPIPVTDKKYGFQVLGSSTSADGAGTFTAWLSYDDQDLPTELDSEILSYDLEYRRAFELSDSSRLIAGVGFRQIRSDLKGFDPFWISFDPEKEVQSNYRAFLMSEWSVSPSVDVTVGGQIEHNHFSGWELQPTARVHWQAADDIALWSAVTRSARTPSLEEVHLDQNSFLIGDPDFESERATSYELGVRKGIGDVALIDLTGFYNEYDDLHLDEFDGFGQYQISNGAEGDSHGLELAVDVQPFERWRLRSAYSYIQSHFEKKSDGSSLATDDYHPEHIFNLRSYYDVTDDIELDAAVYVYEGLGSDYDIADRVRLDLRLGWHPVDDVEIYVGGQQVDDPVAHEYDEFDGRRRQFYVGLRWSPSSGD